MARVEWTERFERPGWDVEYTLLGGQRRAGPLSAMEPLQANRVRRYLSQAFVATTAHVGGDPSHDVAYWAAVCTKVLQRGTNPIVPPLAEALLDGRLGEHPVDLAGASAWSVIETLVDADVAWALEPACVLDPTWERPMWDTLATVRPELRRWTTPQAPLEAIAGSTSQSSRWVDWVVWHPAGSPAVVEVDGSGHERQRGVDRERDRLLRSSKVATHRLAGPQATDETTLGGVLDQLAAPDAPTSARRGDLRAALLGPPALHRFAHAVIRAVCIGALPARAPWIIEVDDAVGAVDAAGGAVLDVLADVDELWGTGVVPDEVTIGAITWIRNKGGFQPQARSARHSAMVSVVLDVDRPPHAALPDPGDVPTVVIRHAFLPGRFAWAASPSNDRRNVPDGVDVVPPLERLLHSLFGWGSFREGQAEAITRVLRGTDGLVMLPTGSGKSLVYQMAAMLRPGAAVVVDPIVSLIDDQELRLRNLGFTRVVALHGSMRERRSLDEAYEAISSGDNHFVLMTPERLQIERFRDHLSSAADAHLVNLAVVDEAHCVSEWGHDFRTAYLRLGRNLRHLCANGDSTPPLLALTGTASPRVLDDMLRELAIDESSVQRPSSFDRPNLHYETVTTDDEGMPLALRDALVTTVPRRVGRPPNELYVSLGDDTSAGIVFVPHTNGAHGVIETRTRVSRALEEYEPVIEIYSGQAPRGVDARRWSWEKREIAARFERNDASMLVATKAFGMGIDKQNIRYTIHYGMPSSIEAYAQEAGRAGRDGAVSQCVLIASVPPPEAAGALLADDRSARSAAYARWRAARASNDLMRQLYFLYGSFPDPEIELTSALALLDEFGDDLRPGGRQVVPWEDPVNEGDSDPRQRDRPTADESRARREKALYRLSLIGVVDDYTIDYGARSFTVDFEYFDRRDDGPWAVDTSTLEYLQRLVPGRMDQHRQVVAAGPSGLRERIGFLLGLTIDALYSHIEPARVVALDQIYRLVTSTSGPEDVRGRINGYLGDGPLAAVLPDLVARFESIAADAVITALDQVGDAQPAEWAGASARQLEATPDHPVALLAAALAEAWVERGEVQRFEGLLRSMVSSFESYGVERSQVEQLLVWTFEQLRNRYGGRRSSWRAHLWTVVPPFLDHSSALRLIEDAVLAAKDASPLEKDLILLRRLRRIAPALANFVHDQTGVSL